MVTRAFMGDTHANIAFLLKFNKLLIKFHPSDAQNIAVVRKHDRGKSGLRGTTHRLMTERSNPTIRAAVTKRLNSSETGNLCVQQLQIGPLYVSHIGGG